MNLIGLRMISLTLCVRHSIENNFDKGVAGTLLNVMDHCVTPFGKRLFKRWIAKPLRRVEDIEDRLNGKRNIVCDMGVCFRCAPCADLLFGQQLWRI